MKRTITLILAVLTAITAVFALFGCDKKPADEPPVPTLPPAERTDFPVSDVPYGKTITTAANYANSVNGYYTDSTRRYYRLENLNGALVFNLVGDVTGQAVVSEISNTKGEAYLRNTADTFVTGSDGRTFYAGDNPARANLYDEGFYYYNLRVLDQTFGKLTEDDYKAVHKLSLDRSYYQRDMSEPVYGSDGSVSLKVKSIYDPYACFKTDPVKLADYEAFSITLKSDAASDGQFFFICGKYEEFTSEQCYNFNVVADGEFHTYTILFDESKDMSGELTDFRIDLGARAGETIVISDVSVISLKGDLPPVKLDRAYHVYPDKITESVRIQALSATESLSSLGTVIKIPCDTVEKIVINDNNGPHYDLAEVDWNTAVYAGFDVKNAGIFGIILGYDESTAGKLSMTVEDGSYVLVQKLDFPGKKLKKNGSVTMARTLYTDESHDFGRFLETAYYERAPLEITVEKDGSSKKSTFVGYDCTVGAYMFNLQCISSFDVGYLNPLDEHKIKFEISPDSKDRTVYMRGNGYAAGCLECAVLLDENNELLPVKVECCKNFGKDGEELFFTNGDSDPYGLSIFPVVAEAGKKTVLTLANLYEQWGNYRLKQVSSIRWHSAYYHLSLGVTETNCIHIYSTATRLPDHRGLSTVYWADESIDVVDASGNPTGAKTIYGQQPQHCNVGAHTFLQYTDSDGNFNSYENIGRTNISAAGPTLADITLNYVSYDGKVLQSYRHVEMPQTDENRAYYEIDYEFLSDVTVNDVKNDFSIYAVTYNYDKFGYLDASNKSVITDMKKEGFEFFKLGSDFPYFDCFHKTTTNPKAYTIEDASCNVSCLIGNYDITVGGKQYTKGFVVRQGNRSASLTLDLDGKVTFKKGDHIKMLLILMPWGDFFSEDDANVRMVRINTLQNPIKVECASGNVAGDRVVPTVSSANGESAEFTLSGGYPNVRDLPGYATAEYTKYKSTWERDYNITVKVTGIKELGVPAIYEKSGDSWERYVIASSLGYDGYTVEYASDGTFTYTFVVTMTEAKARTFKLEVVK